MTRARAATAAPIALPLDVRVMNGIAAAIAVLLALGVLVAAVLWLLRAPAFSIRKLQLEGDLARNSVATVRANVAPQLKGSFFTIDLDRTRAAFETLPWVRRAVVRRVWPDRLRVALEEHRPAALWEGEGDEGLVNSFGEVFQANTGEVEDDGLPVLHGPEGSAAQMLAMVRRLGPAFAERELAVERVHLSNRGSWRLELAREVVIELGRGSEDEVVARSERFLRTLPQITNELRAPLVRADLRHADGYAVKLLNVTTGTPKH